jgi:sulfide dehydrogenase cytochrome subunit
MKQNQAFTPDLETMMDLTRPALLAALAASLASALTFAPLSAQAQAPAADALLARNLAATCANCHGTQGNARGDMKPLAGMSSEKLLASIADYKSGAQPATIMHQISKGYTDEQMKLIAGYFAAQQPKK